MPGDLSEDEMEMQLLMEAEQYIPYSLEEVALDFTKMSTSEDGEQAQILLAASRKESIESLVEIAEIAELKPKIVDENFSSR
jgi:type IV pilus assembly protein PilM